MIAQDQVKEMNAWVDEQMWIKWQNVKTKGLEEAKSFKGTYWAIDNRSDYLSIDQNTMDKLLKGQFKTLEELRTESFNADSENLIHTIFTYRVIEEEIEDYYDVIDCVFTKK